MSSQKEFEAAADWLSSTPATASQPNEVKLELYGLFKYITLKTGPTGSRPSIFSPAARAKHDAWLTEFEKSAQTGVDAARVRYVDIAKRIGWVASSESEDESEISDLDDLEGGDVQRSRKGKGKAGLMGGRVSIFAQEEAEADPIHEAIVDDSLARLQALVQGNPTLVNERDEFGYTPLHIAADRDRPDLVRYLLSVGADKRAKDEDGQTPLTLAQISGRDDIAVLLQE